MHIIDKPSRIGVLYCKKVKTRKHIKSVINGNHDCVFFCFAETSVIR